MEDVEEPVVFDSPQDRYISELQKNGYPVAKNEEGVPFIPGQYIIDFTGIDKNEVDRMKQDLVTSFGTGAQMIKNCGCKYDIELWEIDSLKGQENDKKGKNKIAQSIGHEEVKENYYALPDGVQNENTNKENYTGLPSNFEVISTSPGAITIAMMDSGLDYTYQDDIVNGKPRIPLWKNPKEDLDGLDDDDEFCYVDDIIGWDFVNDDNDPMDDNSHGTHLAGHIADLLREYAPEVDFRFMALKILDENGVGNTFSAICAAYYVTEMKAKVANASWGYYGDSHELLSSAIKKAQKTGGANIMCSSGNDGVAIVEDHYPGSWFNDHRGIVSWGFLEEDEKTLDQKSNYFIPYTPATPGTNIESIIPKHLTGQVSNTKTGSSVSTARCAAITAAYKYRNPSDKPRLSRRNLTELAKKIIQPDTIVRNGDTVIVLPVIWVE